MSVVDVAVTVFWTGYGALVALVLVLEAEKFLAERKRLRERGRK